MATNESYYAKPGSAGGWNICTASNGQIHFSIPPLSCGISSINVNGSTASVLYKNGTVKVYDCNKRQVIR